MSSPAGVPDCPSVTKSELHDREMFLVTENTVVIDVVLGEPSITVTRVHTGTLRCSLTLVLQGALTLP